MFSVKTSEEIMGDQGKNAYSEVGKGHWIKPWGKYKEEEEITSSKKTTFFEDPPHIISRP
jgi:hypothetical protein